MTKIKIRSAALMAMTAIAGTASAKIDIPWDGAYLGVNAGEASSSTCNSWALNGARAASGTAFEFGNRDCSNSSAPVGGVRIGENFQYGRLMWGVDVDLDYWGAKESNQTLKYSGTALAPGTYLYSSKANPGGFAAIGPRIGYAGDTWLPYLEAGSVIAAGSHNSALFYTPTGAAKPTASFGGGKDFSPIGWVVGGGFELGLNGAWSITAEYLHANFGKGSNSSATCNGAAPTCASFSGTSFDNTHAGFRTNIFRVGITYWFGYWEL